MAKHEVEIGFLRRSGPSYGAVGRRGSRCTRLGAPLANHITPFLVIYRSMMGLFQQFVGAYCCYSLQLSERTFLEGSLAVRRFVILRKIWSAQLRR
jgi:hypothetical protein